jgi:hypothetical protein
MTCGEEMNVFVFFAPTAIHRVCFDVLEVVFDNEPDATRRAMQHHRVHNHATRQRPAASSWLPVGASLKLGHVCTLFLGVLYAPGEFRVIVLLFVDAILLVLCDNFFVLSSGGMQPR